MINNLGKNILKKMSTNAFTTTTATQCQMRLSSSVAAAVSTLKGKHFVSIDQLRFVADDDDDDVIVVLSINQYKRS
jgi:hypothetical protein